MRFLKRTSYTLLVLVLVLSLTGLWLSRRSFPMTDGRVAVHGLLDQVEVVRDVDGVPHIYADSEHDLYFAQGYVHAQERFWQMDFWRHIGQGRLAEMFGESQLDTDIFLRSLGFTQLAQQEFEAFSDRDKAMLESYAGGVNAYLADHAGSELSLEYAVLFLQNSGYQPEPWEPIDTLTWARMMAWELKSNFDLELQRAAAAAAVGVERANELFPAFPEDKETVLGGAAGGLDASVSSALMRAIRPALDELAIKDSRLQALIGRLGVGIGSNNWVVSGMLTESGKPLLANDPHLPIQMPSIWFENALHCDECDLHVTGFSFAGVPGVVIGHNDRIAWGVTSFGQDHMDVFVDKVNPDNPDQYEVDGAWQSFDLRTETVHVAGSELVEIEVRSTHRGPVLTGIYGSADLEYDAALDLEVPEQFVVSVQWTALNPSTIFPAIAAMNRATNWDEFRAAASQWDIAGQNIVYADVDGNIGYQAVSKVPIRNTIGAGVYPSAGWTSGNEWIGFVPFDAMPRTFNPASGMIASANQAPWPLNSDTYLGPDWAYGYRGTRIYEMLRAIDEPITPDHFEAMQADSYDAFAAEFVPVLLAVPGGFEVKAAQEYLRGWTEGPDAYVASSDSGPAALFYTIWQQTLEQAFHDELPDMARPDASSRWFVVVRNLTETPDDAWWDNVTTERVEDMNTLLAGVIEDAWALTSERLGSDPAAWRWGDLHTATFENQSLGQSGIAPIEALFNRGGFQPGGTGGVVNATSWDEPPSLEVTWVPSMRMIVDLSDLSNSRTMHTTGQSGHAFHEHYIDFAPRWAAGTYHPMRWAYEQVQEDKAGVLTLIPGD